MEVAYRKPVADVLRELQVQATEGLSKSEATKRLAQNGFNELPKPARTRVLKLLFDRFRDLLVIILLLAGVVSLLLGHVEDAIIIAVAIGLDSGLSFLQVWRTERTLEAMRQQVEDTISVLRDGDIQTIPAKKLVQGDIIVFRAGERIPADARLIEATGLKAQEAALTGEANDVSKSTHTLNRSAGAPDQRNMVFAGTTIVAGTGTAVVTTTGTATQFGKIAQMLRDQPSPTTPLRRKLQKTGLRIGYAIIGTVALLTVIGLLQGETLLDTSRTAITLVVSAIPEDLTMILTIALTVGVSRILKKGGVVRKLSSGETLGAATIICTDKTGTLTEGKMRATGFHFLQGDVNEPHEQPQKPMHRLAYTALAISADAEQVGSKTRAYVGSATQRTALEFVDGAGFNHVEIRAAWQRRDKIPFNTRWKYSGVLADHPTQPTQSLFIIGAPDVLLDKSSQALDGQAATVAMDSELRFELQQRIEALASQGKRLLAVAVKRHLSQNKATREDVSELLFLGVLSIDDPVRQDAPQSLQETIEAGVDVKLITGDHAATARAVGRQVGLPTYDDSVATGDMLARMDDEELSRALDRLHIFARVEPLDKQRIVRLLQNQGHVVAMTGDGINDAVALKGADIGVAMQGGSDVAREAGDLVLLQNSFSTIVAAIKEGRVLRDNVKKVIAFLLATNAAEVAIFLVSVIAGLPLPLTPAQILWINLVTDGTSDIALSLEPAEDDVMKRRPEHPDASLLSKRTLQHIAFSGIVMTISSVSLFAYLLQSDADLLYARTMTFALLSVSSLLSVWSFRSLSKGIIRSSVFENPWVFVSTGFSFALQMVAVYLPAVQSFFGTVPLAAADWLIIIVIAVITVIVVDFRKYFLPVREEPGMSVLDSSHSHGQPRQVNNV